MSDEQQGRQADYPAVLADLKARRAQLDQAIEAIEGILSLMGGTIPGGSTPSSPQVMISSVEQIATDAFFNMATPEAVKRYLGMVKKKQSVKQIVEALERGGVTHTSKNFYTTVYTALSRLETAGEVMKVGKDWGLAEWYPGRRGGVRVKRSTLNGSGGEAAPDAGVDSETD